MLVELRVRDLGVIADLDLVVGQGMTALTGETGAGKTLVVEALELLLGGRADPSVVRAGAVESVVEGRFAIGDREVVLSRAVPAAGRSRAYVDGRMAPASLLSGLADELVDLHGQHAHQSLLHQTAQREAVDTYAGTDLEPVTRAQEELAAIDARLAELGGDPQALARTVDLLRFQLDEIGAAQVAALDEDEQLAAEESVLTHIGALRTAIQEAQAMVAGSDASHPHAGLGAIDLLGAAAARLSAHASFSDLADRLSAAQAEAGDVAGELRLRGERLEEDPERLEAVRRRLQLFVDLRRKYGPGLDDVLEFERAGRAQLADLESAEETRGELEKERSATADRLGRAEEQVGVVRREAAPRLAAAIEAHLHELALPGARLEVAIGDDRAGSDVELLLGANPGEPLLPLAKVASGGELARAMLATRLVLSAAPPTLVFDEVDAGIGGEAALAVGRALAAIGRDHQVLVVTHLAQVAAFADQHVLVSKSEEDGRTDRAGARCGGRGPGRRALQDALGPPGQPCGTPARKRAAHASRSVRHGIGALR